MINLRKYKPLIKRSALIILFILAIYIYINSDTIKSIVNIIVVGFIFAYALKPLRNGISERFHIPKKIASIIIIISILGMFVVVMDIIISNILSEGFKFELILDNLDYYIAEALKSLGIKDVGFVENIYGEINENINRYLASFSNNLVENSMGVFTNVISFAIVPVVTYYFLVDGDLIYYKLLLILPTKKRVIAKNLLCNIDKILSRYIVSQLLLCCIIAVLTFIAFRIIGIKFALLLGLLNGIFNIIPYFGPVMGGVPAVFIALMDSPGKAISAIVAVILLQQLEGNILSPKITGDSTNMHPLVIIILLLVGEKAGGFIGMVLAVPMGVIVKVIYEDINNYLF